MLASDSESVNEGVYEKIVDACGNAWGFLRSYVFCYYTCCIPAYFPVDEGKKGVIQKFGKLKEIAEPGLHYVNPFSETLTQIDTKTITLDLEKQVAMTKDNLSIVIDAVVYYKIIDIEKAVFKVKSVSNAITQLSHATLRNVIGTRVLQECLEHRDELATSIKDEVAPYVKEWGIDIGSIKIKDIKVPQEIATALSSEAISKTKAKALIITADANVESAKRMKEASDLLSTPSAMQIRYLQTLEHLGNSENAKLIFVPPGDSFDQKSLNKLIALQDVK